MARAEYRRRMKRHLSEISSDIFKKRGGHQTYLSKDKLPTKMTEQERLECFQIAQALGRNVWRSQGLPLSLDAKGILVFETIVKALSTALVNRLDAKCFLEGMAAYFGEAIIAKCGGNWSLSGNIAVIVLTDGRIVCPIFEVIGRITGDADSTLSARFAAICGTEAAE